MLSEYGDPTSPEVNIENPKLSEYGRRNVAAMNTISFDRIAEEQDLPSMLRSEGIEIRNGKALCPFHDNTQTPALSVYQVGGRWRFRCHSCDAKGDAITWRAMRKGIKVAEAARELGNLEAPKASGRPGVRRSSAIQPPPPAATTRPRIDPPGPWADRIWQVEAERIIVEAERVLWSSAGRDALDWLRARGLLDFTIRRFQLGFIAETNHSEVVPALGLDQHQRPKRINAMRGITIPWAHPEAWYPANESPPGPRWAGCNVRRLAADVFGPLPSTMEKCMAFAGSHRGYPYPHADLVPGLPLLLAEGEWDAMIAWQELGWIANIATIGGTKGEPRIATLDSFAACPHWLLALHNDPAGNESAKQWAKRSQGKSFRLMLPPNVDLNDMHLGGMDLRDWLRKEYDLLDWPWPLRSDPGPSLQSHPIPTFEHDYNLSSFHDDSDVWEAGRE